MKYPPWAPTPLVELHKSRISNRPAWARSELFASDLQGDGTDAGQLEKFRKLWYKSSLDLPWDEGNELLGKLITDLRMKNAWETIAKRVTEESEYIHFWRICHDGVLGWRGEQQLSRSNRRKFFEKIEELASELSLMMSEAREFNIYSINKLISGDRVKDFLEIIQAPPFLIDEKDRSVEYAHFWLSDIIPEIHYVLHDIGAKAKEYSQQDPPVLKPNSDSAAIQYFIRMVSSYLKKRYGTPLHEVVAASAGVTFSKEDIDSNYVRSLLKQDK